MYERMYAALGDPKVPGLGAFRRRFIQVWVVGFMIMESLWRSVFIFAGLLIILVLKCLLNYKLFFRSVTFCEIVTHMFRSDSGRSGNKKNQGFDCILFFMLRSLDLKVICSLIFLILNNDLNVGSRKYLYFIEVDNCFEHLHLSKAYSWVQREDGPSSWIQRDCLDKYSLWRTAAWGQMWIQETWF